MLHRKRDRSSLFTIAPIIIGIGFLFVVVNIGKWDKPYEVTA